MPEMTAKRRGELRAEAHKLKPIVLIGDKGLTDEVVAEVDRALKAHELIKVRASTGDRDARDLWLESICTRLEAHPIQQIGKIFVIYREKPAEEPKRPAARPAAKREGEKPGARPAPRGEAKATTKQRERAASRPPKEDGAGFTRSGRPRSRTPSRPPASGSQRRRPRTSR